MSNDDLKRLYIEPTSNCNFNCAMCPRNSWIDETIGEMDMNTYQALINQAKEISSLDTFFVKFLLIALTIHSKNDSIFVQANIDRYKYIYM